MRFLSKITGVFGKGKLKKEQIEELKNLFQIAVADGEISDREIYRINEFYRESELSHEEFQKICEQFFLSSVEQAINDRRVTDKEFNDLMDMSHKLNIQQSDREIIIQNLKIYKLLNSLEEGENLPICQPNNIILQKGEIAHIEIPAQLLEERVTSRTMQGNSKGVSVRIIKGVSFNIGKVKGSYHSTKNIIPISDGRFVITNQRLIFSGNKKSVNGLISKLLDFQIYSDALQFSLTNRQKPITVGLENVNYSELCGLVISRLIS
jgi:hypothetical protein